MTLPKSKLWLAVLFGAAEFLSFFIIVANTRAVSQGNYLWTAISDTLFSAQNFVFAKLMIDNKEVRTWQTGLGITIGGTLGSLFSIWVTKTLYGH